MASTLQPDRTGQVAVDRRHGFTLVELLVTFAVIAVLIGLLVPAVQTAREAARRTQCAANLRQLGVAMHSYHDLHQIFPPGNTNSFSAFAAILPFIDQAALYQKISFEEDPYVGVNAEATSAQLPMLRCPSDGAFRSGVGMTNFVANNGAGLHVTGQVEGVFSLLVVDSVNGGGPVSARDVTDGLSNTVAFSEVLVGDETQNPRRAVWAAPREVDPDAVGKFLVSCESLDTSQHLGDTFGRGRPWIDGNYPATLYNHMAPPNSRACSNGGLVFIGSYPAASMHPGGVLVCLADGSTRFIADVVDVSTWRSLGTRRSGDAVGQY